MNQSFCPHIWGPILRDFGGFCQSAGCRKRGIDVQECGLCGKRVCEEHDKERQDDLPEADDDLIEEITKD